MFRSIRAVLSNCCRPDTGLPRHEVVIASHGKLRDECPAAGFIAFSVKRRAMLGRKSAYRIWNAL
jgi:hypothetical protein